MTFRVRPFRWSLVISFCLTITTGCQPEANVHVYKSVVGLVEGSLTDNYTISLTGPGAVTVTPSFDATQVTLAPAGPYVVVYPATVTVTVTAVVQPVRRPHMTTINHTANTGVPVRSVTALINVPGYPGEGQFEACDGPFGLEGSYGLGGGGYRSFSPSPGAPAPSAAPQPSATAQLAPGSPSAATLSTGGLVGPIEETSGQPIVLNMSHRSVLPIDDQGNIDQSSDFWNWLISLGLTAALIFAAIKFLLPCLKP